MQAGEARYGYHRGRSTAKGYKCEILEVTRQLGTKDEGESGTRYGTVGGGEIGYQCVWYNRIVSGNQMGCDIVRYAVAGS